MQVLILSEAFVLDNVLDLLEFPVDENHKIFDVSKLSGVVYLVNREVHIPDIFSLVSVYEGSSFRSLLFRHGLKS